MTSSPVGPEQSSFGDFTEDKYRELLILAKQHWRFASFCEAGSEGRLCLWRHDIDVSPQRALRLAQIESDVGAQATYFVLLHSFFYNALESEVARLLLRIRDLGHEIGLHFDGNFYVELGREFDLAEKLGMERDLLSGTLGCNVRAFAFHNGDLGNWRRFDDETIAGMVNTYAASIRKRYGYVSDSNGYWRFRNLREVLSSGGDERLHVLTHPEWWTPEPLSPRNRIVRSVEGRSRRCLERYDSVLAALSRRNVR